MVKSELKEAGRYRFHHGHPHYKMLEVDSRLRYFKPHATRVERTFAEEISHGLDRGTNSRFVNPKFFYDEVGSELFEAICSTPEYYLTRTEIGILEGMGGELGSLLAGGYRRGGAYNGDLFSGARSEDGVRLVELGSGSSVKTRIILDVLLDRQGRAEYFPIDISDILTRSSALLLADYPHLAITGIIDTYEGGLEFLRAYGGGRSLIMFLGSSYGNLPPDDGIRFLRNVRSAMKPGDMFLMGLDMVKDTPTLESAYNDAAGMTSRFNLNVLSRMNAELGADFDLDNFAHRATYNEDERRVEMHLESLRDQTVTIPRSGFVMRLERGELIHTESSYKYEPGQIRGMLNSSGLGHVGSWTDANGYFTLVLAAAC